MSARFMTPSGRVPNLDARYERPARECRCDIALAPPVRQSAASRPRPPRYWPAGLLGIMAIALCAPGFALTRAVLVRELQLPPISLNLNVTFATSDLRLPPSKTPEEDIKKLTEQLKAEGKPDLHLQLGRLLLWVGRFEEAAVQYRLAIGGFDKLLEQQPENAEAHQQLAEALVALGDDEGAVAHIEEALVLDEKMWTVHELSADLHAKHAVLAYNQGMTLLMQNHLAAAEAEAAEAMQLSPKSPRPHIMVFLAKWLPAVIRLRENPMSGLTELGKFEELSEGLKKAASLASDYPKLQQFAIACKLTPFFTAQMAQGLDKALWPDLDEPQRRVLSTSRDELIALSQAEPTLKADALLFTGVTCFMMGEEDAMYQRLAEAAEVEPKSTTALETMVGFQSYQKKWAQALKTAGAIVERKPSGKAYSWVGRIQAEQRRWKPAEEAFRTALSYDDSLGIANLGLGVVLLRSGAEATASLLALRTAWEHLQDMPEAVLAWGIQLGLIGEVQEGKRYVASALSVMPDSPGTQALAKEFGLVPD